MSSPMRLRASVPYIKVNDFNTIFNSNPNQHSKKSNMMYISNRTIPQKIKNNNIRTSPSKNSIHARNLTPDDIIKQFAGSSKANFAKEKKIVTSLLYELNYLKNEFTLQFKNESNNKSNSRTQNIVNQKEKTETDGSNRHSGNCRNCRMAADEPRHRRAVASAITADDSHHNRQDCRRQAQRAEVRHHSKRRDTDNADSGERRAHT